MSTAIGVFDRSEDAERAVHDLLSHGFDKEHIGVVHDERVVHGYRTTRAIVTHDKQLAADGAAGALVSVLAGSARAEEAERILSAAGAASVETREGEWSQWGAAETIHDIEPEGPLLGPGYSEPDPLLDLESNKGGT